MTQTYIYYINIHRTRGKAIIGMALRPIKTFNCLAQQVMKYSNEYLINVVRLLWLLLIQFLWLGNIVTSRPSYFQYNTYDSRHGASTCVLVLESTLSTFFEVLGGAFKHFSATSIWACACTIAHYSIGTLKHFQGQRQAWSALYITYTCSIFSSSWKAI